MWAWWSASLSSTLWTQPRLNALSRAVILNLPSLQWRTMGRLGGEPPPGAGKKGCTVCRDLIIINLTTDWSACIITISRPFLSMSVTRYSSPLGTSFWVPYWLLPKLDIFPYWDVFSVPSGSTPAPHLSSPPPLSLSLGTTEPQDRRVRSWEKGKEEGNGKCRSWETSLLNEPDSITS